MMLGIEIECYAPQDSAPVLNREYYHRGTFSHDMWWKFESDSSLNNIHANRSPVEIISNVITTTSDLNVALQHFRRLFDGYEGFPLVIDSTCGCHLHIGDAFWNKHLQFDRLLKLEKDYRKWLYAYDKKQSFAFKKHYYRRDYSKPNKKLEDYGSRHSAFYNSSKGLEWRAFNLIGVQSYDDIEARLVKAFTLLEEAYNEHRKSFVYPQRWMKATIHAELKNSLADVKYWSTRETIVFKTPKYGSRVIRELYNGVVLVDANNIGNTDTLTFPRIKELGITELTFPTLRKSKRIYKTKYYKVETEA